MATVKQTPTQPGIRAFYQPKGIEKEMLTRTYKRYWAMRDSPDRKRAEMEWARGRKQWEALREVRGEDEWQSNHIVPLTTAVVESALAEIVDTGPQPLIMPRGSEDSPKATIMSHAFSYSWEIADSDLELEDVLHDSLIEGTGIGQEYLYSDIRTIKTSIKNGNPRLWNEEKLIEYNDCYLEAVKNDDFFVDEVARSFRGPYAARDCIRRYIMDIADFKAFFQGPTWDPLGNASKVIPGGDTNYWEWYKPPEAIDKKNQVEVLWYWVERPDDWLCVIANDVVVVLGPNPYKHKKLPFARAVDVKRTHRFYGKGEAALLESIQDELNTLRRMVIDRNHLDIDKMFVGSNRLNLSEDELIARPHGIINADDENGLKPIEYGDIPRSVELSQQHLSDDATLATGINPRAEALPTTGTATEAAILKESTLKRIRLKVRRFEREFLTRVARLRVSNILQYYPEPKLEEIIGEAGTEEFKQEVDDLRARGLLQMVDNKPYKKVYKEIRLKNQSLVPDARGNFQTQSMQGYSFFEMNPNYFLPKRGSFDITFEAGSTIPISKPLLQTKAAEMYDRLLQLIMAFPGIYDPKKLGDLLLKVNDYNPSEFSVEDSQQNDKQMRLQMAVQLAQTENQLMMKGKKIPSTPYQPVEHTNEHIQFTGNPDFQKLDKNSPIVQQFIEHITGELQALQSRPAAIQPDQGQQQPGGMQPGNGQPGMQAAIANPAIAPNPTSQNGGNQQLTATMPDKIQGGGQVVNAAQ